LDNPIIDIINPTIGTKKAKIRPTIAIVFFSSFADELGEGGGVGEDGGGVGGGGELGGVGGGGGV